MDAILDREAVSSALEQLEAVLRHDECRTCECTQGFLVQLRLDADDEAGALIHPWLIPRGQAHPCLGCDPCPPGDQFAIYLRHPGNSSRQSILLM